MNQLDITYTSTLFANSEDVIIRTEMILGLAGRIGYTPPVRRMIDEMIERAVDAQLMSAGCLDAPL